MCKQLCKRPRQLSPGAPGYQRAQADLIFGCPFSRGRAALALMGWKTSPYGPVPRPVDDVMPGVSYRHNVSGIYRPVIRVMGKNTKPDIVVEVVGSVPVPVSAASVSMMVVPRAATQLAARPLSMIIH